MDSVKEIADVLKDILTDLDDEMLKVCSNQGMVRAFRRSKRIIYNYGFIPNKERKVI